MRQLSVLVPKNLLERSIAKKGGLSLGCLSVALLAKSNNPKSIIYSHDDAFVASKIGVSKQTFIKYKPDLISSGLLVYDNVNVRIVSLYRFLDEDDTRLTYVKFDNCNSLQDFKNKLRLYLIRKETTTNNILAEHVSKEIDKKHLRKIQSLKRKVKSFEDLRPSLVGLTDCSVSKNENVNACNGIRNISRRTNLPSTTVERVLSRYKELGDVSISPVIYSRLVNCKLDHDTLWMSRPNRYCYPFQVKGIVYYHHGSIIKIKSVSDSFFVKDKFNYLNRTPNPILRGLDLV
jgi:hypothetical protein